MSDEWQKLTAEKAARILAEVNPALSPSPFSQESSTVRAQNLPFWPGYQLLELTDLSTVPAARKYAAYKPGDVSVMDWTNGPIYAINETAPIRLDDDNVAAYAKFFFNYVRGRNGRFLIVETIDDVRWQVEPPVQGRKVMQEMLSPVTLESRDAEGTYTLSAFMVFKDALFRTKIHVQKDGLVMMSEEELAVEGMPVLQDLAI